MKTFIAFQEALEEVYRIQGWDIREDGYKDIGHLLEEAGEVAREVRRIEDGRDIHEENEQMTMDEKKTKLAEELGDLLSNIAVIASRYEISLEHVAEEHISKMFKLYGKRQTD